MRGNKMQGYPHLVVMVIYIINNNYFLENIDLLKPDENEEEK